ncbi:hypothetical protein ACHAXS_014180 [Conticribra weissflogii]
MAKYFHPIEPIHEKYPENFQTRRLENVTIIGDGTEVVCRQEQRCYYCTVPGIDNVLHIVAKHFKVEQPPVINFEEERPPADILPAGSAVAPSLSDEVEESRRSLQDVERTVSSRHASAEDVAELRSRGIEVYDDDEPAPENSRAQSSAGEWFAPTICPRREHMNLQEFYVWLGCNFFMACFPGIPHREDWWSTKPISLREGAPFRLNAYMTKARFLHITAVISFTNRKTPTFLDKFHDIRQMLHSIADGDQGKPILWRIKLQEGKDRPKDNHNTPQFPSEFEHQTNTSALMLEITKPIHHTGKVVIMNSQFCVTAGIIALQNVGVFGQALVKKYGNFWPQYVPGQIIDDYMRDKPLGYAATFKQIIEGKEFLLHCQNDDRDVTTKIMSTHGIIQPDDEHVTNRFIDGDWKSFRYVEPLSRQNQCKHLVNEFDIQRHDPVCLEDVWTTNWWPIRQFTFLCSIAEVNAINSRARSRKENADPLLPFRRKLAVDLMKNQIGINMSRPPSLAIHGNERAVVVAHEKKTRPTYMGSWDHARGTWKGTKTAYILLKCAVCKTDTRVYCLCNPAVPLCERCCYNHEAEHNSQIQ